VRFVVAGAGGYVGGFLCRKLIDLGHDVVAISRRGVAIERAENVHLDLSRDEMIVPLTDRIDVVINLIAQSNLGGADDYFSINRDLPARLASMCNTYGVPRIVHLSTIGVHGVSTKGRGPFSEADEPNPQSGDIYAISKLAGETALIDACKGTSLEYTILRPPAVYGPRASTFGKLIRFIKTGIPLPIAGIRNENSYLGIHNLIDAILVCSVSSKAANETFVLCDGNIVSTADVAKQIAISLGVPLRQFYLTESLMPIRALKSSLALCNSKFVSLLNWKPPVNFDDGVREVVDAYSRN
jgi:UDP-N-acetyl-alpha-D-quinovosamine dehydrogenase